VKNTAALAAVSFVSCLKSNHDTGGAMAFILLLLGVGLLALSILSVTASATIGSMMVTAPMAIIGAIWIAAGAIISAINHK
jgi:hypothetical protein